MCSTISVIDKNLCADSSKDKLKGNGIRMSKTVMLELEDTDYDALVREAQQIGMRVEELAAQRWRQKFLTNTRRLAPEVNANDSLTLATPAAQVQDLAYPAYPGFAVLRPEVQAVAHALAARKGGTADQHAQVWWTSLAPKTLSDPTQEAQMQAEQKVKSYFGSIDSGDPHSADNDRIDTDLARHYLAELDSNESAA